MEGEEPMSAYWDVIAATLIVVVVAVYLTVAVVL